MKSWSHYADSCSVASLINATGSAPEQLSFLSHHSFGLDAAAMMMMINVCNEPSVCPPFAVCIGNFVQKLADKIWHDLSGLLTPG